MGYYIQLSGAATITPDLKPAHYEYLQRFIEQRHMTLHHLEALAVEQPADRALRELAGLPPTPEFILLQQPDVGFCSSRSAAVKDYNSPYKAPSLWCPWVISGPSPARLMAPDDEGKYYEFDKWLIYLVATFFIPWGYVLSGGFKWQGEDRGDFGRLAIYDNVIDSQRGGLSYCEPVTLFDPAYVGGSNEKA